ncbi:MAG: bifunctional tetrahydrofolate synthase/dihydrofolate synthase [Gammaproteobacteria bacterium]|nr:bifunctional tetrahydrofolate synthase/dihydrofolate synthase [Gammaproteobacteria bacterium]
MRQRSLTEWLAFQEQCHPSAIDLGLARVATVYQRLQQSILPQQSPVVVTIAGTNGKGSSLALLEATLMAAGYAVGSYTSPHLLRYNERIRINAKEVSDAQLCTAFTAIEAVRGEISLTYFEWGTLAALYLFALQPLPIWLLEVGLGGRLDAVNIVTADVALITAIDIDHVAWLGSDRETIGREKAGIMRPGGYAVCSDLQPPQSIADFAAATGCQLHTMPDDYDYGVSETGEGWWFSHQGARYQLPWPALTGSWQLANSAGVFMVLLLLRQRLPTTTANWAAGLQQMQLPGRFTWLKQQPAVIVDVAHNPQAARSLAENLQRLPCRGQRVALFALLQDKDSAGVVAPLVSLFDAWRVVSTQGERGLAATLLAEVVTTSGGHQVRAASEPLSQLLPALLENLTEDDQLIVFGTFQLVAAVMELFYESRA